MNFDCRTVEGDQLLECGRQVEAAASWRKCKDETRVESERGATKRIRMADGRKRFGAKRLRPMLNETEARMPECRTNQAPDEMRKARWEKET